MLWLPSALPLLLPDSHTSQTVEHEVPVIQIWLAEP